jgi:hypothetical protein
LILLVKLVHPTRFELVTFAFGGQRSILRLLRNQLSYPLESIAYYKTQ